MLERALTRAAIDHDLGAIDECEGTMKHREQKLERLLTQHNIAALEKATVTLSPSLTHTPVVRLHLSVHESEHMHA